MSRNIILASASPRRKELLARIGMEFSVKQSNVNEQSDAAEPGELVKELSALKALDIYHSLSKEEKEDALVIGADTVVVYEGRVMGKPADREDAVRMLSLLQDETHQVYTGVTLVCCRDHAPCRESFYEKTDVTLFPMSPEEIDAYVESGEPMDKAGAYGIQGKFAVHIRKINGDYNNVVGLPVGRLYQEIKKFIAL